MLLFLASIASNVLEEIASNLGRDPRGLRVAFVPTASNPSQDKEGVNDDRKKLVDLGFEIIDVDIAAVTHESLRQALTDCDVIFVAGGNTFYLLQESNKSGFSELLPKFVRSGKPYIGSSAGSVLVGPTVQPIELMDDPAAAPDLTSFDGLGLIDLIPLVHYGNEEFEQEYKNALDNYYSSGPRFVLVRDNEFILVRDDLWKLCGG